MQHIFGDLDSLRFVDGRLSDERRSAYLAHLAEDPAEAERVAVWARQNETIRAAFAGVALESMPPALRIGSGLSPRPASTIVAADVRAPTALRPMPLRPADKARAAHPETADVAYLARPRSNPPRPAGTALRLPVSAALLMGLAMLIVYVVHGLLTTSAPVPTDLALQTVEGDASPGLVSRAADAFVTYALDPVRPVEFTAVQAGQLSQWFRRRLGTAVEPADLSLEGWTLLGGRLVPSDGAPAAFFVYESRAGDRLGVLVGPRPAGRPLTLSLDATRNGTAVMRWSSSSRTYAVAVDKTVDWLARNGEALKERIGRPSED